jgi:hypothetical protein
MEGFNMVTGAREAKAHNSLAAGTYMSGVADGTNTATGSPGANLGTGANVDVYTPTIEAA